jgi:transcriptional regulator with XRE-family HTH domain
MDRTEGLVKALRVWYDGHDILQKDLAALLGLSPQGLAEVFAGRNKPTGEQALQMVEILKDESKVPIRPKEQPDWLPQPTDSQSSASRFRATITKNPAAPANREQVRAVVKKRALRTKQFTKTLKRSVPAAAPVANPPAEPAPRFSQNALTFFLMAANTLERTDIREGQRLLLAHHYLKSTGDPYLSTINPIELLKEIKTDV